jgi:hypothetical protein
VTLTKWDTQKPKIFSKPNADSQLKLRMHILYSKYHQSTGNFRDKSYQLLTIEIKGTSGKFSMKVDVAKVNKGELVFIDNPRYQNMIVKESSWKTLIRKSGLRYMHHSWSKRLRKLEN